MSTIVNNCTLNGQPCPTCAEFGNFNGTQERHYINSLVKEGRTDEEIAEFQKQAKDDHATGATATAT